MNLAGIRDTKDLIKFLEEHTDYRKHGNHFEFGQIDQGMFISTLLNFLDDNPGAIESIVEFMDNNHFEPETSDEDEE